MGQIYVEEINKVLREKPQVRPAAAIKLIETLKPPKAIIPFITTDRFLDGYTIWDNPNNSVFRVTPDAVGYLTCTVCEKKFKWKTCERALRHILNLDHHKCCKAKSNVFNNANSQRIMSDAISTASGLYAEYVYRSFVGLNNNCSQMRNR